MAEYVMQRIFWTVFTLFLIGIAAALFLQLGI